MLLKSYKVVSCLECTVYYNFSCFVWVGLKVALVVNTMTEIALVSYQCKLVAEIVAREKFNLSHSAIYPLWL